MKRKRGRPKKLSPEVLRYRREAEIQDLLVKLNIAAKHFAQAVHEMSDQYYRRRIKD